MNTKANTQRSAPRGFWSLASLTLSTVFVVAGCLPQDPRPEPAEVQFSVARDSNSDTFTTDDGWSIRFDQVLGALGYVGLTGEEKACNAYAEEGIYLNVLDLLREEKQIVGTSYGLGQCKASLSLSAPRPDSLLGSGVSERDVEQLRVPQADIHRSLAIIAEASNADQRVTVALFFDIPFSWNCPLQELRGGDTPELLLNVHPEALFTAGADTLAFEPFLDADDNGNGEVTLSELQQAWDDGSDEPTRWTTFLEDNVLGMLRYGNDAGACEGEPGTATGEGFKGGISTN